MLDTLAPTNRPTPRPGPGPSHIESLSGELDRPGRRKGERTRARMLVGCARLLEERGFTELRIADIARAAGATAPAFYRYFPNRRDAAAQVLERFAARLYHVDPAAPGAGRTPDDLMPMIVHQLACAAANPGLLRTLSQTLETLPHVAEAVSRRRRAWLAAAAECLGSGASADPGLPEVFDALMAGALQRTASGLTTAPQVEDFAVRLTEVWLAVADRAAAATGVAGASPGLAGRG